MHRQDIDPISFTVTQGRTGVRRAQPARTRKQIRQKLTERPIAPTAYRNDFAVRRSAGRSSRTGIVL
ncbi:MAG: hypothetical protein A2Y77_11985 [Planctomycetes bacterium RBG_13_62_9]|nr:MAG: hypothetical protein A2Y77_11985 [Planctomycetes bacterium RBG_13_62_9]